MLVGSIFKYNFSKNRNKKTGRLPERQEKPSNINKDTFTITQGEKPLVFLHRTSGGKVDQVISGEKCQSIPNSGSLITYQKVLKQILLV